MTDQTQLADTDTTPFQRTPSSFVFTAVSAVAAWVYVVAQFFTTRLDYQDGTITFDEFTLGLIQPLMFAVVASTAALLIGVWMILLDHRKS